MTSNGRPSGSTAHSSAATTARTQSNVPNESSFTSFSDLGAAIPASAMDQFGARNRQSEASTSLLTLSGIKSLLHPTMGITNLDERTPLLRDDRQEVGRRRSRKQGTKRYVGGDTAFAVSPQASSEIEPQDLPLGTCRQCEASKTPISAVTLTVVSHILFAVMSLLAEILARDKEDSQMNQLLIVAFQALAMWVTSLVTLLVTRSKDP